MKIKVWIGSCVLELKGVSAWIFLVLVLAFLIAFPIFLYRIK